MLRKTHLLHPMIGAMLAVILLAIQTPSAYAQIPDATNFLTPPARAVNNADADDSSERKAGTDARRNAVGARLASSIKELKRQQDPEDPTVKPSPELSREVELLKQIDSTLAQQQNAQTSKSQLSAELEQINKEIESLRLSGLKDEPPYSFIKFDQLSNELGSAKDKLETLTVSIAGAQDTILAAKQAKDSKDAAYRLAKEAAEKNKDEAKRLELESALKAAELEAKLADETLTLKRMTADNDQYSLQIASQAFLLIQERHRLMAAGVRFSDADLQEILVEIDKKELEGNQAKPAIEKQLEIANRELNEITSSFDDQSTDAAQIEELNAKRLIFNWRRDELNFQISRLARLARKRELWNRRFKVNNELATTAELTEWSKEAKERGSVVERERRVQSGLSNDLRKDLGTLDARLQSASDDQSGASKWLKEQQEALQQLLLIKDLNLAGINSLAEVEKDLLTEIEGNIETWTIAERLEGIANFAKGLWNTELMVIDELPITVGKVVIGLIFLIAGFFVARLLSRFLSNRLLRRFGLDEGAAAAIKSLSFYVFVCIFTLLALRIANVPLTVFTLMGGALAIGVGFGSQAIINNFISGLIILAERPIQVGDLVKLDDLVGNVTHIGTRSTRIRTGDNLDIIVPNSKILESNVLNYTLADDRFRTSVAVGLAYGSPTREASRLLTMAADEHGLILKNPKPFVWFRDFGSDSLNFELHVWMKVRTLGERLRIESDLRFRIDQLFREARIVIAYPQRDVHLNIAKPLDIRMMKTDSFDDDTLGQNSNAA